MYDKKEIILNKFFRDEILKLNWPRKLSIKHDKLKYISKPYTNDDLLHAVQNDSIKLIEVFLNDLPDYVIHRNLINECMSYTSFQMIWDRKFRCNKWAAIFIYVEKDIIEIVEFLLNKQYKLDYQPEVRSIEMFNLLKSHGYNNDSMILGENVIIHLLELGEINYNLGNAIYDGNHDVIDYFLDITEYVPSDSEVCELINVGYENINLIKKINKHSLDIAMVAVEMGNYEIIENLMEVGFDRDVLISYSIEKGYEDIEQILYNY